MNSMSKFLVFSVSAALLLSGCGHISPEHDAEIEAESQISEYQEDIDQIQSVGFYWISVRVPKSWEINRTDNIVEMVPSVGGLAQLSNSAGINFVNDGSEEVDVLLDALDGDVTHVTTEKTKGSCGNAVTYTVSIERSQDGIDYEGFAKFIVSGHGMYSFIVCVPSSDYRKGYDEVLHDILDSFELDESYPPMGEDENTEPDEEPHAIISSGTYKVGSDIEAGEYKLTCTSSVGAYWEVTNSSSPDADIVGNDNFDGSTYVTVNDGQYLKLSRCTAEKVS